MALTRKSSRDDPYVMALLIERSGYERYGQIDRVAAVDAEIKRARRAKPAPKPAEPPPDQADESPAIH